MTAKHIAANRQNGLRPAWPPASVNQLIALKRSGMSHSQIGLILGFGRGAVSGKVRRLKSRGML